MAKINVKAVLHNITEDAYFNNDVIGIKENNKIKYIDNKIIVVIEKIDNKILLKRSNDEYEIVMLFDLDNETTGRYVINNLGEFKLNVITNKLILEDDFIEIDYQMILDGKEKTEFNYKIEYKEM